MPYRFELSTPCHDCPLSAQCLGKDQRHRTVGVGEHHTALQARRREQQTETFQPRMKHRNAIEGTQSELVRGHGLRPAKDRGSASFTGRWEAEGGMSFGRDGSAVLWASVAAIGTGDFSMGLPRS